MRFWGIFPRYFHFSFAHKCSSWISHAKFQKSTHLSTSITISPVVASLITVSRVFVLLVASLHNENRKNLRTHMKTRKSLFISHIYNWGWRHFTLKFTEKMFCSIRFFTVCFSLVEFMTMSFLLVVTERKFLFSITVPNHP